ncbi:PadR family transcriptional regulator [candidate division KSB1 bacterium]
MKLLSRAEEIILTAVLLLDGNAYGITIRDHIKKVMGWEWSFATIYDPLNKLTKKGFVIKRTGKPTAERGGRRKCLYEITPEGKSALREIREIQERIWAEVSILSLTPNN